MGLAEIERDIKLIRSMMESSSRYTNIPAAGYLVTGLLGGVGVWLTYGLLGGEKLADMTLLDAQDLRILGGIWVLVFLAAVGTVVFFSWRKARQHQIAAWNSLAARMVLSQIPVVIVAGFLTLAMARQGAVDLIPGMWLGIYGTVLYSFSYFTGFEHKIEGSLFMLLGVVALFGPDQLALILLGLGFGGIHLMAGIWRLLMKQGVHVSTEPIE
ncbi:hypothetical protein GF339_15360 [candidate division KSB3 bacterium]|uniref:Uncharacterized protein n=1 Tax=candidate division KSB3 bacterium TaxID=2044937 RepID=A0A9D5Q6K9_9BACT|nr:hypothetical protein [candidate division KSB3 bacterium]MBD3325964.1 hypothetical protein [candidate division KSB3 bacterium]